MYLEVACLAGDATHLRQRVALVIASAFFGGGVAQGLHQLGLADDVRLCVQMT